MSDVIVVGGGVVGLAVAWRAARAGLDVTVVDDDPGGGASHAAAGMLAPVTEAHYGEEALVRLGVAAAARWPDFADDLTAASGRDLGYRRIGTILVGFDADDNRFLDDLHAFQQQLGLEAQRLRSRDCRRHEPLLSPQVRGGVLAPGDHQVDPRAVVAALLVAATDAGATVRDGRVARLDHADGRVSGVTLVDGVRLEAPDVVLAAGCWSASIDGLPSEAIPPVRPVKGQILRLRGRDRDSLPGTTVRGMVRGRSVYLVPRADGRVVVGATQEELGFDRRVTAGGVRELLDDAVRLVPGVDELELVEVMAGLRPGTPDNLPLIGRTGPDGLVVATGHHRGGVLLTPITAEAVVAMLTDGTTDPAIAAAAPDRDGLRRLTDRPVNARRTP